MKVSVIICFALSAFVAAEDLHAGKHQRGDILVASRRLIAGPQARNGIERPTYIIEPITNIDGIITTVEGVNALGSEALVNIQAGGPGKNYVVVGAFTGPQGHFDVQLDVFAIPSNSSGEPQH
ncbi:uncharacterized protein LOC107038653 [Diachasma alloeum]|uniref:uncharacterized protein LOC107038653 n=1 Tax=Diachasma alloeum TaxID=454923 RepID=UPI0007381022|nr:uncharacterized protein LOC107038653 [Diachasma alloeum]